jgi:hypothetical protein
MASVAQQIPKIELEKIVQELPEMVDMDDIMYRLYVFQKIQDGERDIDAGRPIPHEQVVERFAQKWQG